ncbi:hypothetical protein Pcinc_034782 [Petrolisthes cinctipes]|uniref:Uncharacterized protein n=1 Tax=Petrolisthes cinctipes TaxID=88211 RepID=A0AAE1BZA3_PETCI|nr:hypothetical protein Pcinc_034782 [Petrolisthes cinctipes]
MMWAGVSGRQVSCGISPAKTGRKDRQRREGEEQVQKLNRTLEQRLGMRQEEQVGKTGEAGKQEAWERRGEGSGRGRKVS